MKLIKRLRLLLKENTNKPTIILKNVTNSDIKITIDGEEILNTKND